MSFFDSANLGDLLIAAALRDFAAAYGSVERLSYSGDPFHFPDPNALPARSSAAARPPSLTMRLLSTRIGRTAWRVKQLGSRRHLCVRNVLARAQLLLLGGGNMIFDLESWTRSSDRFGYFVDVARRAGTPTFGISLGIGPFASARQHRDACRALDRCAWRTFRDQQSLELYLEHGRHTAELGVDPVLLMEQVFDRPVGSSRRLAWNLLEPRLVGSLDDRARGRLLREHASAITELISDGRAVELFTTDRADELFLAELERLVGSPACRVRPIGGLADLLELYLDVDLVVASRMHALIVAFTQGVPVVGLSWQQKVQGFFDLVGRPGQCLPFVHPGPETRRDLVSDALAHPDRFAIRPSDRVRLDELNAANRRVMSNRAAAGASSPRLTYG